MGLPRLSTIFAAAPTVLVSLMTLEARVVVASIETYVSHAEPVAQTHAVAWLK